MKIGVLREIKPSEYRVALTPTGVKELVAHGHRVFVEREAGEGSTIHDEEYEAQGAEMLAVADDVFAEADLILKVKEPQAVERKMLREGQLLFTYLHLAPDPEQTRDLLESEGCSSIETLSIDGRTSYLITDPYGMNFHIWPKPKESE